MQQEDINTFQWHAVQIAGRIATRKCQTSSKKIEWSSASIQCRLHTRPNRSFAPSLLRVHDCSTLVSPRRYHQHDWRCTFGYTRSCAVTKAVSATSEPTQVETHQVLHVNINLIPIIIYYIPHFNRTYALITETSHLLLAKSQQWIILHTKVHRSSAWQ
jgi:hypothetical protein